MINKQFLFEKIIKDNLIPVEFTVSGINGGILVPSEFTDEQIKRAIKQWVKAYRGRWDGKFKKTSKQEVIEMIKNTDFEKIPQYVSVIKVEDGNNV